MTHQKWCIVQQKFAKKWSKRFWSTTTAYRGKTDYSGIRDNSIFQKIFGRGLGPADLYPVADEDAKKVKYIKAFIRAPQ